MKLHKMHGLNALKRRLHIIALLLDDTAIWNASKLADVLANEQIGEDRDEADAVICADGSLRKAVRLDLQKYIESTFGYAISRKKGGRKSSLAALPTMEEVLELLKLYVNFVAFDTSRDIAFQKLVRNHNYESLSKIARIYFAAKTKKKVRFSYTTNEMKVRDVSMNPYHFVVHSGTIYLVGRRDKDETVGPYIFERIENLQILDKSFDEDIPPVESFFTNSFGAFIWNWSGPVKVKLRYDLALENVMKDRFEHLGSDVKRFSNYMEMTFYVHDYEAVCRELFFYCERAEILEPEEVRETMIDMLKKSMSVYSK